MDENIQLIILRAVERSPQWVRHDLTSKDAAVRGRAEETLAAMIADALGNGTADSAEE